MRLVETFVFVSKLSVYRYHQTKLKLLTFYVKDEMVEDILRFMSVQEIDRIFSPREIYQRVTARVSPAETAVPKGALEKRSSVTAPICLASQPSIIQIKTITSKAELVINYINNYELNWQHVKSSSFLTGNNYNSLRS